MFRAFPTLLALALLALLPGCSSVIDKSTQKITIKTPGANESFCYIDNGEVKYKANPPQPLLITKTSHVMEVRCLADGWREKTLMIEPGIADNFGYNALNLFIPGALIDDHTGAMYQYPEVVVVDFTFIDPQPAPLPAYQKTIEDNPDIHNMEEFRSGWAALQSDRREEIPEMRRRTYTDEQMQDRTLDVIDGAVPPDAPSGYDQVFGPDSEPGPEGMEALFVPEPENGENSGAPATAEGLTRQMNPTVFENDNGGGDDNAPTPLSP